MVSTPSRAIANITPFFEANFSRAEISVPNSGTPQIFPSVPDFNGFNPCNFVGAFDPGGNQGAASGIDCPAADNALLGGFFNGNVGLALPVTPVVTIAGDRNNVQVTQEQYRGVLGVRGDLPFIGSSWTFEVAGVYMRSEGSSTRDGIREDRLALALGLDPTADYDGDGVVDNDGDGIADDYDSGLDVFGAFGDPQFIGECNTAAWPTRPCGIGPDPGCVPVNLFAPSVLGATIGDFASQAERDYLFGVRSFDTSYEQTILSAFVPVTCSNCPLVRLAWCSVPNGAKTRSTRSRTLQRQNGLFFGFFADSGATGSRTVREAFGEIDIPLMAVKTGLKS